MSLLRRYKNIFIIIGVVLTLAIGGVVTYYQYILHKHSQQITDMLYLLSELDSDPVSAPGREFSKDKQPAELPQKQEAAKDAGEAALEQQPTEERYILEQEPAKEMTPSLPQHKDGGTPLSGQISPELQEKVQENAKLMRRVDLKDQLYAMQIIKQFSVPELQKMQNLYQEGGASRTRLLELLREKLTEEEIKKIRAIAEKYKTLLK